MFEQERMEVVSAGTETGTHLRVTILNTSWVSIN